MNDNAFNRFIYTYAPVMGGVALVLVALVILFFVLVSKF